MPSDDTATSTALELATAEFVRSVALRPDATVAQQQRLVERLLAHHERMHASRPAPDQAASRRRPWAAIEAIATLIAAAVGVLTFIGLAAKPAQAPTVPRPFADVSATPLGGGCGGETRAS